VRVERYVCQNIRPNLIEAEHCELRVPDFVDYFAKFVMVTENHFLNGLFQVADSKDIGTTGQIHQCRRG
jgi:hypothetical protein